LLASKSTDPLALAASAKSEAAYPPLFKLAFAPSSRTIILGVLTSARFPGNFFDSSMVVCTIKTETA
jgi:hypothetical protein